MKKKWCILFCLWANCLLVLTACKKDKLSLGWTKLNVGNGNPINSIYFLNEDTGFAAGGVRYEIGTVFLTTGGNGWSSNSPAGKALYNIQFRDSKNGFATGYDGFIFRTTDGGKSWSNLRIDWENECYSIEILSDSITLIAGYKNYKSGFILKTIDNGNTWRKDTFDRALRSICFVNSTVGFAAGYGIIYKTTDTGESWKPTEAKGDFFMAMDFPNGQTGYAVGYEGTILKTSDGGESWENLRNGNNILKKNFQFQTVDFIDENTGFAAGRKGAMLKTKDGGKNWSIVKTNFTENIKSVFLLSVSSGFISTEEGSIYRFVE